VVQFILQQEFEGMNQISFGSEVELKLLVKNRYDHADDEFLMPCILLLIESGVKSY
jgi:hypothetical protein